MPLCGEVGFSTYPQSYTHLGLWTQNFIVYDVFMSRATTSGKTHSPKGNLRIEATPKAEPQWTRYPAHISI